MNVPNILTLFRIGLIPVFTVVFYLPFNWSNQVACMIFIIAAITDLLDGFLARKLQQTSKLGAFLDPVADKLMVAVALVLLVERNPGILLTLPAAVIIGREIAVSALREWMAELGARSKVAVSVYGKIKTIAQMTALPMLIYAMPLYGFPVYGAGLALLYVAAGLTLVSMCQYLASAWPKLKEGA
ncbi:MAG: CDP-diacylglycerol--glycerol-3-phosphate 3-phosphatidyltransferase [Gammaproteobacteria bacterium]|nr:CDP-diacylglycerol--glycerol-3-phosphate 3-phosphatidyltransferase [Gammaproteobacteria bacterium]MCY4211367.1 CDP-diacylglycerol--glycerol-3-phosphate 3-phosphatidyltransferase [Gammaproteobacteria bacterium]MCY4281356.1 CDP-diacylglycerol--glycerol-3-phosphate 3-phosphatidyltransferase [Gammaproteobacteria bacterium]MCY4337858.1 CDP-diacylglycerol--glycerol-3-phosphate 3-phosphatidyltransferase [Gammaproteobacteria bacterium]